MNSLFARQRGICRVEPRSVRGCLALLVFGLLSGWTSTAHAADRSGNLDATEQRVVVGINQIRSRYGLSPVRISRALTIGANVHSWDMVRRRYYGHDTLYGWAWNMRIKYYVRARVVGETLDLLYGPAGKSDDPRVVVSDWLHSPRHRAVLLTPSLHRVGVARATMRNGRPAFFTADFAS